MRRISLLVVGLASGIFLGACAAHPDPIIDMQGVNEKQLERDWAECEGYTEQIQIPVGTAKGAAGGAVVGAATGAIAGSAGAGAGYGAIFGATQSTLDADRDKQRVFKRCLSGRGYRVLN
jgi:outer membrane lipoprotein SlyB